MIKGKELSTKEYESLEIELNKILGKGSLESVSLKYNPIDGERIIYSKSKHQLDTELLIDLVYDDAKSSGLMLTAQDEHILVYDESSNSNYMIDTSDLSVEKVFELSIFEIIAFSVECSIRDYINKIHDAYYEDFDHQLKDENIDKGHRDQ